MKEVQSLGDIRFGTLARAAEGLTQWRPLLLGFLTLLLTGVVIWLGQWLAIKVSGIFALIMMVLAFVVMMAGFSGVGIMLMDKAKEQPVRSFAAAASAGLDPVARLARNHRMGDASIAQIHLSADVLARAGACALHADVSRQRRAAGLAGRA